MERDARFLGSMRLGVVGLGFIDLRFRGRGVPRSVGRAPDLQVLFPDRDCMRSK